MSDGQALSEGLIEVVRLSTSLAYRVLNTQLIGSPVPPDQVEALVEAARLLHESSVDWPPGMTEALRRLSEDIAPDNPEASEPVAAETFKRDEVAAPKAPSHTRRFKGFIKSFQKGWD